ncbi:hypothetical protein [Xanthomonas hortorum]|uniref:hypothetical protein n=1 Tax=Xanthomonas hortorum TaxID=56454 RepID=UPI001111F715|nr:hypothetical protein [Xanthomonas hortorum]MCC4623043.1 hypothetical protein [Xanthomonas campestris pv. nigromaculans]MCC8499391.1 hypothetical protein [Xanthomonas hortorum pv. gardneri]MCC8509488.1 hypothetical protein [Xanthomonas hortorum pv. gardneri]MCC8512458.1 hypothetical protein [Xanthomonas hortorum pv. gardneri]MCC8521160.1 hypothetical protein [Xanthomonas hortorum pv. gardneri]
MTRKKVAPAWACVGSSAHGDMPVYAGIGARQEYLGKIQRGDGFEESITAWALIAQVCRKQARESNVPDSPAGQIAACRSNSLMHAGWVFCSVTAENAH